MKPHIGWILALGVFVVQLILLPRAGMTWDEPMGFFMGRANLKFWMTGNRQYLTDLTNPELFGDSPIQYIDGARMYPPFPALVASTTSFLLAEKYHLLDLWDAHHAGEVILGALGVWAMYGLLLEAGMTVPVAAGMALVYTLYPTVWDQMRNDVKDIPLVSLLLLAMYFFLRAIRAWREHHRGGAWRDGLVFAVAYGLAGSAKPTAATLLPIAGIWFGIAATRSKQFRQSFAPIGPFVTKWVALLFVSGFIFFVSWPWLWDDPAGKLMAAWSFFKTVGYNMPVLIFGHMYRAGVNIPLSYPFTILLIQSPVELTALAVLGMGVAIHRFIKRRDMLPMLFVLWFWLGISRFLIPGMIIYARVRHLIDVLPAFIVLAGYGISWVIKKHRVGMVLLALVLLHEAWISVRFFPYESSYFNVLVGGTKRVAERQLFDVGPSSPVAEAMMFIARDSGSAPTLVYACQLTHVARFYAAPNMRVTSFPEQANYNFVPNAPSWFDGAIAFEKVNHKTVYTIRRAGADLFWVFENTNGRGWNCGRETKSNYVDQ